MSRASKAAQTPPLNRLVMKKGPNASAAGSQPLPEPCHCLTRIVVTVKVGRPSPDPLKSATCKSKHEEEMIFSQVPDMVPLSQR